MATPTDLRSVTAKSLRLVLEVVGTERAEKERKDSERMRLLNEFNDVPEFLLVYPEPEDARSLLWYRYDGEQGAYDLVPLSGDRRYQSQAIPGLAIEVLEPREWSLGRKVRVYHRGEAILEAKAERQARELAEHRAAEALAELEHLRALLKRAVSSPVREKDADDRKSR